MYANWKSVFAYIVSGRFPDNLQGGSVMMIPQDYKALSDQLGRVLHNKTQIKEAVVIEGNIVALPSNDEAPACESDRWFYAVAYWVAVQLDDGLYIHNRFNAVDYSKQDSIDKAQAFADKVTEAGEIDLTHWNRRMTYQETCEAGLDIDIDY
jgi:hypothetical protein